MPVVTVPVEHKNKKSAGLRRTVHTIVQARWTGAEDYRFAHADNAEGHGLSSASLYQELKRELDALASSLVRCYSIEMEEWLPRLRHQIRQVEKETERAGV